MKGGVVMNTCVLTGNLGGDPEVFYSQSGEPVANFNLAFRAGKKKTGWIRVTAFNKLAEITEKHLHRGARVAVSGSLDHHKWESEQGESRSAIQMIAGSIEFIKTDGRGFEEGQNRDDTPF
jgi:single-strand DNA-binding protein